ncbi:hypothetical protein K440DRAFT_643691 [Wilcoxina mikolae CBS 423.85]|nr:hypothetical protein K440DRAFT_643691 [Wilcoxina mikolae CBS 423.85]
MLESKIKLTGISLSDIRHMDPTSRNLNYQLCEKVIIEWTGRLAAPTTYNRTTGGLPVAYSNVQERHFLCEKSLLYIYRIGSRRQSRARPKSQVSDFELQICRVTTTPLSEPNRHDANSEGKNSDVQQLESDSDFEDNLSLGNKPKPLEPLKLWEKMGYSAPTDFGYRTERENRRRVLAAEPNPMEFPPLSSDAWDTMTEADKQAQVIKLQSAQCQVPGAEIRCCAGISLEVLWGRLGIKRGRELYQKAMPQRQQW